MVIGYRMCGDAIRITAVSLQKNHKKLEILQSLGGLYDGLAFYALHWSYAPLL